PVSPQPVPKDADGTVAYQAAGEETVTLQEVPEPPAVPKSRRFPVLLWLLPLLLVVPLVLLLAAVVALPFLFAVRVEPGGGPPEPKQEGVPIAQPRPDGTLLAPDALDAAAIPAADRFDGQPNALVAVFGEHASRH